MAPLYAATFFSKVLTLSSALGLVYGGLAKCIAFNLSPRFAIVHAATGLSIPPEIKTEAVPAVPTGSPPAPFICSQCI